MKKAKFVFLGGQNAGKTSILRRYFQGTFYGDCRMPTIGADVYSTIGFTTRPVPSSPSSSSSSSSLSITTTTNKKSYDDDDVEEEKKGEIEDNIVGDNDDVDNDDNSSNINDDSNDNNNTYCTALGQLARGPISIQVWDTPGRERFMNTDGKTRYTASFSDNFLKHLDAVCLVYDASSSTSFTHVLSWYYELIERTRRMKANHERKRHLPIVIVGNKIDIIQDRENARRVRRQKEQLFQNRSKETVVQQRDVLGLAGTNWRGRDYRYEYASSSSKPPSRHNRGNNKRTNSKDSINDSNNDSNTKNNNEDGKENRLELLTYLGTNTNYLEAILSNEVYRGSYLDSLLRSEDNSHPDKDMVQLWCTRNGLIHLDVSAKSGAGIDDLINQLIEIALKQMEDEETTTNAKSKWTMAETTTDNSKSRYITQPLLLQRNDELDLHQRYGPKSRSCLPFPLSSQCCCR